MNAEGLIKIAVSVLVLCIIVGLVFGLYSYGRSVYQLTVEQEDDNYTKLQSELDWTKYVGRIVTGNDVKNVVVEEVDIYEIKLLNGVVLKNEVNSEVNDSGSKNYIDPIAKFSVTAIEDEKGLTIGLKFEEVVI